MSHLLLLLLTLPASADEGMWPFNQFPKDSVHEKHKFDVTADFLDHLRLASVRIAGGSGSFVSPNGLLLTSRQAVGGCLTQLKRESRNEFFYAESAEPRCPGLTADRLLRIEDVTAKVKSSPKDNIAARNAAIAQIEKTCPRRCNVVRLFSGGRYDLYEYETLDDLRLVFAPEYDIAFFGKERDSISYLRYGLNIAFLRAYENGQPAATPQFLKINSATIEEGDLVFAAGNPTPTERSSTAAQLAFDRDRALPTAITRLQTRIQQLTAFSSQSETNLRMAQPLLAQFLAEYKVAAGKLIGLRDDRLVTRKTTFEGKIRRAVQAAKLGPEGGKVWDDLSAAYKAWAPYEKAYQILESNPAPESLPQPLEILMLTKYLEELKALGDKQVPLKNVLGSKSPQEAAEAYLKSGNLKELAQLLDEPRRRFAKKHEEMIGALEASAAEKIAQYRFKLFGAADYPDATGTPRVEFGVVKGYTDRAGVPMPYASTFSGLYYRENKADPYLAPKRWLDLKPELSATVPLDFVSTCDIGGGDFGAPTVNRAGELVGVMFDGNLESLPDVYLYSDEQARAVHVAAGGIVEALERIYKVPGLLHELKISHE